MTNASKALVYYKEGVEEKYRVMLVSVGCLNNAYHNKAVEVQSMRPLGNNDNQLGMGYI